MPHRPDPVTRPALIWAVLVLATLAVSIPAGAQQIDLFDHAWQSDDAGLVSSEDCSAWDCTTSPDGTADCEASLCGAVLDHLQTINPVCDPSTASCLMLDHVGALKPSEVSGQIVAILEERELTLDVEAAPVGVAGFGPISGHSAALEMALQAAASTPLDVAEEQGTGAGDAAPTEMASKLPPIDSTPWLAAQLAMDVPYRPMWQAPTRELATVADATEINGDDPVAPGTGEYVGRWTDISLPGIGLLWIRLPFLLQDPPAGS